MSGTVILWNDCTWWTLQMCSTTLQIQFQIKTEMWSQSSWQIESDLTKRSSQATVPPGVVIRTLHPLHSTQFSPLNSTGAEPLAHICPAVKHNLQTTTTIQAHEWSLTSQDIASLKEGHAISHMADGYCSVGFVFFE